MKSERLSKLVSHALRHAPGEYGLHLDPEGWVDVGALIQALRERTNQPGLSEFDLYRMIETATKQRHEISAGRIRALYGHSAVQSVSRPPAQPPTILYHGTAPEAVATILIEGLKSMSRQNVHLSVDRDAAVQVGRRKCSQPVILQIDAKQAHSRGVAFYRGNESVWLADHVPACFISVAGG